MDSATAALFQGDKLFKPNTLKHNTFDASPNLENGGYIPKDDPNIDEDNEDSRWGMFSSILNLLSIQERPQQSLVSDEMTNRNMINEHDQGYVPMQEIHSDPLMFLKGQETNLLEIKLPELVQSHRKYLDKGDKSLAATRDQIITLFSELDRNYEALNEIYESEKKSKMIKYELFMDWINKRTNINEKIDQVIIHSSEGETYKTLSEKSQQIDDRIDILEKELRTLKIQKKLISKQIMETKSLMDIKLNPLNGDLENLLLQEKMEISLLYHEKQISSADLTDKQVANSLLSQIGSVNTLINIATETKSKANQEHTYLSDIFDTLGTMETSIHTFLKEGKMGKIEPVLVNAREHLIGRLNQLYDIQSSHVIAIVENEILAIEKAMSLLDIRYVKHEFRSVTSTSKEWRPSDNSPVISSNNKSLQITPNKNATQISVSLPATSVTAQPAISKSSQFKFGSKLSKYDKMVQEIKDSKGSKTE